MKRIICLLVIIPFLFGCSDDEKEEEVLRTTNFVLGENYTWKDLENEKVYLINSNTELLNQVIGEGEMPVINFEEQTLLLVQILLPNFGYSNACMLKRQIESNSYSLHVNLFADRWQTPSPSKYVIALSIPKLKSIDSVDLLVEIFPYSEK